jgi:hypothetical protein
MIDCNDNPTPITRHLVPESQRLAVVNGLFRMHFPMRLEPFIYRITHKMTQGQYSGGYWLFYTLDNAGFYMAPDDDRIFTVSCENNWQGPLSADALGIVCTLYAYSHLSFGGPEAFARICADHYHRLRYFMMDHAEVAAILGAID